MRVNSVFTNFSTHRWAMGSAMTMVMLAIFFITSSFTKGSERDLRAKQTNLIIRQMGHRLLLQAGDSTSRVLPVTEIKEGTFLLTFENEFVFRHDSLMMMSQSLFPKTQFPSGYTVTVHECMNASIVFGFQIKNTSPDNMPCRGRSSPAGCYTIEIAFPDLYETVEQQKADIDQRTEFKADPGEANPKYEELKSFKVDTQEANPKLEEFKTTTFDNDIDQLTGELKSFNVDPLQANPKLEDFKTTTFGYPLINLVYAGMLVLLGATLLITRFGNILTPVPQSDWRQPGERENQNHTIIKESIPGLAALGKFLFDGKDQRLLLGSEVISLTDKEWKILELLNNNFGELIPRETLMQKVWINEGVITGRSLDMFVSKLRKKLSGDPELRITNVHGKGYKLEIPGMQIL